MLNAATISKPPLYAFAELVVHVDKIIERIPMIGRPTWINTKLMSYSPAILVKIAPKDTRTINRGGKSIFLRSLTTGEVHYFSSLTKASKFLGRNPQYIKVRLQRGLDLPIACGFEIVEVRG